MKGVSNGVSVLAGLGDGTFQTQKRIEVVDGSISLTIADLDNDGLLDLLPIKPFSFISALEDIYVLLGIGDSMFQSPKKIATGTDFLSVADMNDDGIPDLITRSCEFLTFTGGILLGTENGGYQAPLCFESHGFPNQIVAADLNADQALDLVVTPKLSDDISVLLGNGDGSFRSHQRFGVGSFPLDYPVKTVVADINGDKLPDLVAANANSDDVSILIGRGDGSFYGQKRFAAGKNPVYFAVGDLNGDNLDDIVVANKGSGLTPGNVSVLLQH